MKSNPHIAFVIDALPSLGGGEKVLFTALEIFPQADVFTLLYNKPVFRGTPIAHRMVKTSFLDSLPGIYRHHRLFLPLMPFAIERFDLRSYDIVLCFSYAVAHGVKTHKGARHLSYMYTPMRYAWTDINLNGTHTRKNVVMNGLMSAFRNWDRKAAGRVDAFATISHAVAGRIAQAYQRQAPVIYPPVEVDRFCANAPREDFYITVSRLVPHKRLDLVVQVFSRLNLPLLVVGTGSELPRLQKMAAPNVKFLGYVPDEDLAQLLGKARGFICMAEEDFGIAIVEAQAAGCPVIAYGKGGALETVIDGVTGMFCEEQTESSLQEAILQFEERFPVFRAEDARRNAERFSKSRFLDQFCQFVEG